MTIYRPSSLVLGNGEPKRRLLSKKIPADQIPRYDDKTYFFDAVHVAGDDGVSILGPPLLNFRKSPGLPEIENGKKSVPYRLKTTAFGRFTEWALDATSPGSPDGALLDFRFRNIADRSVVVNSVEPFPEGTRVLTAIQKNNRIRWIRDWFAHYQDVFGVEYLVLYDNGSDNFDELAESLPDPTILVDWSFPYGPPLSHDNKFAQIGALNHCRRVFGKNSVIFNFDIDELLFLRRGNPMDVLGGRNVVYFPSFNVPQRENLPDDYSFRSYEKRQDKPRYYARKYIYRASASTGVMPHYVQTQRRRLLADLVVILRKLRNRLIKKSGKPKAFGPRLVGAALRILTNKRKESSLSIDSAYFLHFLGITTHWKSQHVRKAWGDRSDSVEDPFLSKFRSKSP